MLRDRYEPVDLFALVPQLGLEFEPQLAQLDELLDDDRIFAGVRDDLGRRYPLTRVHGRESTPVEVILRMLVVMRLYGWSFQKTEYFVNDSLVLRQFCRVYRERVPDDTTLIRWAKLVGPETLQKLDDRAVELARGRQVTRGRKLRVDTTAVETEIHYPTESGLIGDGVRVVSRLPRRARAVLGEAATKMGDAFRSRVRTVRRLSQQLHRIARRKGEEGREALKVAYTKLIETAKRTGSQAERVLEVLKTSGEEGAEHLAGRFGEFLPRLTQGIDQARRRVLEGESVPAKDKPLSLFEPHAQIIPQFKAGQPVEFGRKIRLDEVEGGIISGYAILEQGGGQDQPYLKDSLEAHQRHFGRAADLLAADRGRKELEKGRRFRRGYRFRAGIEGRIHSLRRDFGLKKCRYYWIERGGMGDRGPQPGQDRGSGGGPVRWARRDRDRNP